ncbi:MAG: hypothetical protein GVY36_00085, partial [Verrucomicrobia bacterium]|nr:hypothetical protein [Verrucomicrobiota bacterium]
PLLADAPALGTVPFTDGFESDAPGTFASGTRQWSLTGGTVEVLAEVDAPAGNQYLKATDGETPTVLSRLFEDPQSHSEVWIDFQLKVGHRAEAPVELSAPRAASASYFGPDGRLRALDGNGQGGGAWLALEHPPIPEGNWARLTVHHNYAAQTWSVWIDGGRRAESLGFRDTVPAFSQLQFDQLNALDDVSVAATEPAALDNDGDGLTNAEELALGTDPEATDTSGDGMSDGDKLAHGLDPLASDAFITSLQADGQGGYLWETEFTATEGFTSGDLHGQNHWNASAVGVTGSETAAFSDPMTSSSMERYFGSSGQTAIWLSFRARLTPGKLPEVITDGGQPLSLVFGASAGSFLSTYDANTAAWSDFSVDSDLAEWNDYTVHLDYATGRAMLLLNGGLVAVDLPFFNRDGMALTRIQLLRDALEAALDEPGADTEIDSITLATAEPADLDFSSDGMTNAEKRTLGLDPWLNDNSGDGFPDVWLVQYGFDPLTSFDPQSDTDGDGLSMADEYAFATDPTNPDTDGDGYLDGEEVIAGTDALEVSDSPDARGYLDWVLTDINQSSPAAAFTVDGKIALQAAGYGLHNTATDRLSLLHQTAQGDFTMTLRIHEFDNPHANAHISLTARRSTDSRSALVSFAARGDNRQRAYSLFSRPQDGGSWTRRNKNVVAFADPPNRYFRLSKSGDVWTASASRDGLAYEVIWEIIHEEPGPYELGVSLNGRGIHDTVRAVVSVEELLIDSDSDGLWDHEELALGTDPYSADTSADGISDYEKAHVFYLDPLASDTELQAVDANAISGADFHSSTGSWTRQNGEVYATDSVGSLFYDVDLAEPGTYRLIVEFTENNSLAPAAGGIFDLRADFAGLGLGTRRNTAAYGKTATVHFDLPHLSAGVHPLRLDWLNSTSGSFLRVREIRLVRFNGPDANENGEADWIENRLALTSQIDTLPQAIHVSPVNIEGASFAAQTVSAQAQPDDQPSESVDLEVHPGLSGRYFLDAPLDPEAATTVRIEDQNGLGQHELRLEWAAFNVVEHDAIDIRLDDSLLLMAEDTNASAQTVQLQLTAPDGTVEVHSLAPGARLQALFDHAGLWLASAELPDPDGDPGATIQFVTEIKVYAGSLNPAPIVFENRSRTWKPTLSSPDIELEADPGVSLIETDPGASLRRFQLAASRSGGNILARLPDAGPILGGTSVQAVVDRTRELLRDQIVETFADGTVMVRSAIQLGDVPDDLEIQINIFKSGVTFEDGTISRHLTAADFDETGRYQFFMLRSPGVRGGNCHRITYRQDGQVLSTL